MSKMMRKVMMGAAAVAAMLPAAAYAGNPEGKIQVKLLATGVLPDGKMTGVGPANALGLTVGTENTKANDNVVPTVAVEYFFTPNVSVETICCLTAHHVTGTAGAITGGGIIDNVLILPATVTLKYHLPLGPVKPYVGAGPSVFFFLRDRPGAAIAGAVADADIGNQLGFALQAGVDVPINDQGLSLSLDAKRYFMRPTAHYYNAAGTEIQTTHHKLDPWVVSAGVAYRF